MGELVRDEGTFVCRGRLTSDVLASVRILCPFVWILCPFSPPQHPTPSLARSQVGTYLTRTALKKTESRPGSLQLIDLVTAYRLCPTRATRWLYRTLLPFCFVGPRSHTHSPATARAGGLRRRPRYRRPKLNRCAGLQTASSDEGADQVVHLGVHARHCPSALDDGSHREPGTGD